MGLKKHSSNYIAEIINYFLFTLGLIQYSSAFVRFSFNND